MRPFRVGVIDYGMGNLHSVKKALALQGAKVTVSSNPSRLKNVGLIVLPGVGSFGAAIRALQKNKMDRFVKEWIEADKPYLGICLGYQLLFEGSEEDPGVKGLGVLKGKVVRFKKSASRPVPHMGWNEANRKNKTTEWFKGLRAKDLFYFVHSYYPAPKDKSIICTETNYGKKFASSVQRGRLFASQFHPEKSGDVGLTLLKNILRRSTKR